MRKIMKPARVLKLAAACCISLEEHSSGSVVEWKTWDRRVAKKFITSGQGPKTNIGLVWVQNF